MASELEVKMNEQDFWKWVEATKWRSLSKRDSNGNRPIDQGSVLRDAARGMWESMVAEYGQQQAEALMDDVRGHYRKLSGKLFAEQEFYEEQKGERHYGSSDSQMDLNCHLVGMGEKEYYKALRSPVRMKHMMKKYDFAEGFFCFVTCDNR